MKRGVGSGNEDTKCIKQSASARSQSWQGFGGLLLWDCVQMTQIEDDTQCLKFLS